MCKLAHVIRYTVLSQNIHFFAVLERWLIHDCETECSFVYLIVIMANADLSLAILRTLPTWRRFTARISSNINFLVLHKCNIQIYFLLLLFGTTFYFLKSRKFSHCF